MAMTHWYFLLLPLVVLAVMSLLRFRGCSFHPRQSDEYGAAVGDDSPVAWFRLEDAPGSTVAKNAAGTADGAYGTAPSPLGPGQPTWRSQAVSVTSLTLGINDPKLVLLEHDDPFDFSIRVEGAFVQVPADIPALQDLTEFTLEALVFPDWDVATLGNYYCVLELAGLAPGTLLKSAGFGFYAGPSDTQNPNSPYSWQVWMGNGSGFQRLEEKKPYTPDDPNNPNPGPIVEKDQATYLAFTFSQSQGQAFLYLFTQDRDLDYVAYELIPVPYVRVVAGVTVSPGMHIGITAQGPLFPPSPGAIPPLLYPFIGQMANVAIYNSALTQDALRQHAITAFFVDSPGS
jgi:hypothetical protein